MVDGGGDGSKNVVEFFRRLCLLLPWLSSKYKRKLLSLEVLSSNSKSREITEITTEDLDIEDAAAEARRNLKNKNIFLLLNSDQLLYLHSRPDYFSSGVVFIREKNNK